MRGNGNHAETGGEQIFRLRLRLFCKKIRLTQHAPARQYWQGLFLFIPAPGFQPLLQTLSLLTSIPAVTAAGDDLPPESYRVFHMIIPINLTGLRPEKWL